MLYEAKVYKFAIFCTDQMSKILKIKPEKKREQFKQYEFFLFRKSVQFSGARPHKEILIKG